MIKQKYILNETYGINGIDRISLKKILEVFSFPKEIKIEQDKDKITIDINLIYEKFEIGYTLNYYVERIKQPEFQYMNFIMKTIYINDRESIKIGDEIKKVLPKIKKYLRRNNKDINFEYKEDSYVGRYFFDDGNIAIFFEKFKNKKIIDYIVIRLPYEDILEEDKEVLEEIKDIMELKEKIDNMFWKKKLNKTPAFSSNCLARN